MHITLQQKQGISYSSPKRHKRTAKGAAALCVLVYSGYTSRSFVMPSNTSLK